LTDWKEIGFSQSTLNNRSRINWMIRVCSTPVAEIPSARGYTDPAGDLFDDKGNPLKAEPYLDIISVDLRRPPDGVGFLVDINVNGPLPSKIDPPLYFDWSIYFDLDSNPNTGTKGSLLYNDIGFDYGVRLFKPETGSDYSTVAYKVGTAGGATPTIKPYCDIVGDKITFIFNFPGDIKVPSKLIWMVVTRKFSGNPINAPLLAADKMPNLGHYETPIESLEIARSTLTRTSGVTVSNTTSSRSETSFFGFLNVQSLQQIGGAAATGGSVLFGWYLKTRKRRFASKYLRTIDSTYEEYLKDPEECKKRMNQMRAEVLKMLENGKIEEAQFSILDTRLEKHLKDLA